MVASVFILSNIPKPKAISYNNYFASDIDSHWAESEIETLINAGILKGSNGKANPDSNITRGEFTALISRTLALQSDNRATFSDIPKGHMFFSEINAAFDAGIIMGTGENTFSSDKKITREEIMLIISRCLPKGNTTSVSFKDIGKNYPYLNELKLALSSGIITGFSDNTFKPKNNATRGECAVMLARLLRAKADIDRNDAVKLSEEFIKNETESVSLNKDIATGRALDEIELKLVSQNSIRANSTEVEKIPDKLTLTSYTSDGYLANAVFNGGITFVVTNANGTRQRHYLATHEVDMIRFGEKLYVYNYNLSLKKDEKINLTWEVYSSPPDYAPQGVNVVSPSSFQLSRENLGVESKALLGDIKFYNSLTRKYMDYAKENGYEVWPIYKTDFSTQTSHSFLNNYDARQTAISYLTEYACKYLIDGINIDFENIYEKNRYLVTKHARELSVMLHELGLVVSVDITRKEPTSANWSMCYDRDSLNDNTDYVMLMAYDEYYASSKTPGSVASLDWTEESIKRTIGEVDKNKLVLGIPFYMRYFETKNGKVTSSKAISMQTAYELINSNNVTYTYLEDDGQYKISWKKDGKDCVFWLENTDTIGKRVELANKYSLAGVGSWRRGLEISKVWEIIQEKL